MTGKFFTKLQPDGVRCLLLKVFSPQMKSGILFHLSEVSITAYKQQIMPVITSSAYPGAVIKLALSFNPADSTYYS